MAEKYQFDFDDEEIEYEFNDDDDALYLLQTFEVIAGIVCRFGKPELLSAGTAFDTVADSKLLEPDEVQEMKLEMVFAEKRNIYLSADGIFYTIWTVSKDE